MAFSCGFYNSLNGDRKYNARQVSELFDGIIRDGVYASIGDKLTVKQRTGMQITVGTGRAWFNHSWSLVDAEYPLTVDQSDLILDRIDAVVLEVNESTEVRDNSIKMVKGTAASSPQKPTMTDTEFVHQYPLAYISVKKGATEITTADIEINVGKDNCPYVTSILEAASIEELYAQWEAQFKGWEEGQKTQFEEWFDEIKGQLSEDAAGNLQIQVDDVKERVDNEGIQIYTHSKSGTVHNFSGNGPNGRALLTANIENGDTFTVNGSPVSAYMGTEDAISSMAGSEWAGRWITFVFDGNTLNFKGGGGLTSVDKSKLIPENIRKGITLFEGTAKEVAGTAVPFSMYASGAGYGETWGSWMNALSTAFTIINSDFSAKNGTSEITVMKKGYYRFYVVFAARPDNNNQDSLLGFRFLKNSSVISGTSFNNLRGPTVREFAMSLNAGDVLTWQIYVRHVAITFYTFLFVYKEHD